MKQAKVVADVILNQETRMQSKRNKAARCFYPVFSQKLKRSKTVTFKCVLYQKKS